MEVGHSIDRLTELEKLYLEGKTNGITDISLQHISRLKNMKVLSLIHCEEITNEGIQVLANQLKIINVVRKRQEIPVDIYKIRGYHKCKFSTWR